MTSADHRAGVEEQPIVLRRASITGAHDKVARIPGIGLMHADTIFGVPPVFTHLLTNLPAIYKIVVFVTVRSAAFTTEIREHWIEECQIIAMFIISLIAQLTPDCLRLDCSFDCSHSTVP